MLQIHRAMQDPVKREDQAAEAEVVEQRRRRQQISQELWLQQGKAHQQNPLPV